MDKPYPGMSKKLTKRECLDGIEEERKKKGLTKKVEAKLLPKMIKKIKSGDYLLSLEDLQRLAREVAVSLDAYDVWLTPTLAEPPVPLGTFDSTVEQPFKGWIRTGDFMPFTGICNVTGQPAMSVPLYWNLDGLPIGTHFVGRYGDEATLFRLAAQLEEARPWANRYPPISA